MYMIRYNASIKPRHCEKNKQKTLTDPNQLIKMLIHRLDKYIFLHFMYATQFDLILNVMC